MIEPLLSADIKMRVLDGGIHLDCNYAGCGAADSWPKWIN